MRWYVSRNGETAGPTEGALLVELAREGKLHVGSFIRDEAGGNWMPIESSPFVTLVKGGGGRRPISDLSAGEYRIVVRDAVFWGIVFASLFMGLVGGLLAIFLATVAR